MEDKVQMSGLAFLLSDPLLSYILYITLSHILLFHMLDPSDEMNHESL